MRPFPNPRSCLPGNCPARELTTMEKRPELHLSKFLSWLVDVGEFPPSGLHMYVHTIMCSNRINGNWKLVSPEEKEITENYFSTRSACTCTHVRMNTDDN